MSPRSLAVCLLSTALLGGNFSGAAAASPGETSGKLVTRTYQVIDLVIPLGTASGADPVTLGENLLGKGGDSMPAAAAPERTCAIAAATGPCPPKGSAHDDNLAATSNTLEDRLIKLIVGTVAPDSWSQRGGAGTIDYYPLGMALVVNQTPEVQERVADLLASLRRLQDVEVAVELRFVTVSEKTFDHVVADLGIEAANRGDRQGKDRDGVVSNPADRPTRTCPAPDASTTRPESPKVTYLEEAQVSRLLDKVQEDRGASVLQAPKLTLFNGQASTLNITDNQWFMTGIKVSWNGERMVLTPQHESISLGLQMGIQPAVSPDRRTVHVKLNGTLTSLDSDPDRYAVFDCSIKSATTASPAADALRFAQFLQTPRINKLHVDRTLQVAAGRTAVLTGWKKECDVRKELGVPVLSEVPYVGELFKNVGYHRVTQCTMILVTPRIIAHEECTEGAPTVCPFKPGEWEQARVNQPTADAIAGGASVLENLGKLDRARKVFARAEDDRKAGKTDQAARLYQQVEQSCPGSRYAGLAARRLADLGTGKEEGAVEEAEIPARVDDGQDAGSSLEQRQAQVAELLAEYHDACSRGCLAGARSIAEKALALDPACFSKASRNKGQ